jgi:SHS2 domain-containing protein
MNSGFEYISTTADGGFKIWAPDLKNFFKQAALALFTMMTDLKFVEERQTYKVEIQSQNLEELMIQWLNELIYLYDYHHVFLKSFQIEHIDQQYLRALVSGETINMDKHPLDLEVKAATYHGFAIKQDEGYHATIIVDL